ncbi:MAG: MFS transporter [Acidimicrobiia bacterium]|nr:MFS transporter [Acidimicrobiia bacterium]
MRRLLVEPNVALLGTTSFITDVSSEMVASVLPLYLTVRLGFTALQFGATDGVLGLTTALTALVGALLADRWRRYREVAGAGYALSAASRLGLLSVSGWLPTLGWLGADRLGKGVRTGPRDALISLSAPQGRLGEAFGLHRTLDTGGALAGPLLAVLLLTLAPGSYAAVFVASFFIACLGIGVLWLFVENRFPPALSHTRVRLWTPVTSLWQHRRFRRVLLATALLSLPAVSDSFLFLTLRHRVGLDQRLFPILFTGEAVVYLALALPCGRLADRIGAGRVLLGGQVALAMSYVLLIAAPGRIVTLVGVPAFLGVFFAATDGVLAALASQVVPALARTTGLAVLGVVLAAVGRSRRPVTAASGNAVAPTRRSRTPSSVWSSRGWRRPSCSGRSSRSETASPRLRTTATVVSTFPPPQLKAAAARASVVGRASSSACAPYASAGLS